MNNRKRMVGYSAASLGVILILIWVWQLKQGIMPYTDQWTRALVASAAGTPFYTVFRWITELGSKSFVQPMTICMTIVFWIWFRNYRPAFLFGFGVLGTHIVNKIIKEFVARERPSISALLDAEGYSFPSGHAMVSLVCYGMLGFLLSEKCRTIRAARLVRFGTSLVIVLIGFSRYIINVHYLTDIMTGYFIGLVMLIGLIQFYRRLDMKKT